MITSCRTFVVLASLFTAVCAQAADTLRSPDGKIAVEFGLSSEGTPTYSVKRAEAVVLESSKLGIVRDDADFSKKLKPAGTSKVTRVEDRYELLTSKRRANTYRANRQVLHFETVDGQKMDVIFQVSNDGLAFRYSFPETSATVRMIVEEITSFHLPAEAKAWLQPMAVATSGNHPRSAPAGFTLRSSDRAKIGWWSQSRRSTVIIAARV
jgi:hypothetical protein